MSWDERERHSEEECVAVLERMFPNGLASEEVLRELAPRGWENSPLLAVFHPSIERLYEESVQMHRNIQRFLPPERRGESPEPTMEEIRKSHTEKPVEPEKECWELMAMCLWDVFSENHEVVDAEGRWVDTGSFRGSAGFFADFLNREIGESAYDYMDFYMGTIWVAGRADLTLVYALIFRRLRSQGLDWVYHFPRLGIVDLRPLRKQLDREGTAEPEWVNYSPSEAVAAELEEKAHDGEVERLRESLDEGYREAVEKAREGPPPGTVRAYQEVYGRLPQGWPPVASL